MVSACLFILFDNTIDSLQSSTVETFPLIIPVAPAYEFAAIVIYFRPLFFINTVGNINLTNKMVLAILAHAEI